MSFKEQAEEFAAKCTAAGWSIAIRQSVVYIRRHFQPGNASQFRQAETEAYQLTPLIPASGRGSVWGTTSDSVGGDVGLNGGYYELKKSAVSKRFLTALKPLISEEE